MLSEINFLICSQIFILLSQSAHFLHTFSTACGKPKIQTFDSAGTDRFETTAAGNLRRPTPCCGKVSLAQLPVFATTNFWSVIPIVFSSLHKTVWSANVRITTYRQCDVLINCPLIEACGCSPIRRLHLTVSFTARD